MSSARDIFERWARYSRSRSNALDHSQTRQRQPGEPQPAAAPVWDMRPPAARVVVHAIEAGEELLHLPPAVRRAQEWQGRGG
jgi:hypothetical protein